MTSAPYLRFPHVRGELVTFVADDDVWLAPVTGGVATRVSSERVPAAHPRLSPDGAALAWTSYADGAPEVRLADLASGRSVRLTHWGDSGTRVAGWTQDGQVLVLSATGSPFERHLSAYVIDPGGGQPRRQAFGPIGDLAVSDAGTVLLAGSVGSDPAHWKRYRGGRAGRLWVRLADEPEFRRILAAVDGYFASPMLAWGRVVFLSDHEGTGNLYSCRPDGQDLRRHTDHEGFYARQASSDGLRVIYQRTGELWMLDDLSADARPVEISLGPAAPAPRPSLVTGEGNLAGLSCDHTGRASAIEVRGTVHWLTHSDGPARALSVSPAAWARLPRVLGTTGDVVWVSDAGGEDALEVARAAGPAERDGAVRHLASGLLGRVSAMCAAPDGSRVAVASADGRLSVVDIATGALTPLPASSDGPATGLSFSPDSVWLAWAESGPRPLSRIRLAHLGPLAGLTEPGDAGVPAQPGQPGQPGHAGPRIVEVTDGRFSDSDPVFTTDGRHLAFLSRRSFDPVYDAHFFDLSFPTGCRPFLVALAADTPSPFGPLPDGAPVGGEISEAAAGPGGGGAGGAAASQADAPSRPATRVDPDGLPERVFPVPVGEALYSSLRAVTGGLVWLRSKVTGVLGEGLRDPDDDRPRPCLERFGLRARSCSVLADELDWFDVSGDGSRLVIADRGSLRVVPSERKAESDAPETVRVDLGRARFLADPMAARQHALRQLGRAIRDEFWVADMADVDWDGVLAAYQPLVARTRTADDFADLLWEVMGELGTSHAYVRSADTGRARGAPVGMLGADLEQDGDGRWAVSRVLPGESSDPRARSPLAAPGARVSAGEYLLAVDGQDVDPASGPGPLLLGTVRKPVELTVAGQDGERRRVVVVPLASDRRLRYQDWVSANRRAVRELSGGQAGYLHIPDMMGEGWAHFHRDLRLEMTLGLLIVDVRHNRGGHVSELVVEKLARRIMGWDMPRGLRPATYPRDAPRGPVVAITNEAAGSDGDMVTAAIRILGLGPVVGARTWGGVVGIDEWFTLADGSAITVPRYAISLSGYGWGVENHGVDPDVEVLITPDDWAAGRDPQLATAVDIGLAALARTPAATPPPTTDRPSRRRPPLPPRKAG